MPDSVNRKLRKQGLAPDEVTCHLKFSQDEIQYHCIYCCKGIFRQQGRVFNLFLAGEPENSDIVSVPFSVQCSRCGCIYHASTINM